MKFQVIAAALVGLLPTMVWSCASYENCLCQNSDGSFDDTATKQACSAFAGEYERFDDGRHYCHARNIDAGEAGSQILLFNNCRFREQCNNHGATGDSNCWVKD